MEEVKKEKKEFRYKKQVALSLIILCSALFILTTFEFVYPIKAFMLGTFGVMLYPLLLITILFCSAIMAGRKFVYSVRYVVYLFLCFFFIMCVFHIIFTGFSGQDLSYGEYLVSCFKSVYTPGGLLLGVFTYPVTNLLHAIAGIVVYGIAFVISLYFVLSYLDSIKQDKKPVVDNVVRYQNFNTITNDLEPLDETDPEQEEEDEPDVLEEETSEGEVNGEEDIFIKDEEEESPEVSRAKQRLGLKPIISNDEEEEEEKPKNKLFGTSSQNDNWQNRAVEKEDKPQKIVYGENQEIKKKENPLYKKDKEYLNTLFSVNTDFSRNPIINAENYEDYEEKMRMIKQNNTQTFKRDYELTVNQTLKSEGIKRSDVMPQTPQQPPVINSFNTPNTVDNSFGIEPNKFGGNLNTNSFNNQNNLNNSNPFVKPNNFGSQTPNFNNNGNGFNPNFNSFNASKNLGANEFNSVSGIDDDDDLMSEVSSSIEGFEDDFIKPSNNFDNIPKVSPLNPSEFNLSQDRFTQPQKPIIDASQKFMQEDNNIATPFDTTKLSSGDVSTSLGNTYNLPKSLMGAQASSQTSAERAAELAKANEPNFGFTGKYVKPPIDLLQDYTNANSEENTQHNIEVLEQVLDQFGIPARVIAVRRGAAFTRYELNPPPGISVRKIHAHASDIALALAAKGDIRIETPIKGKSAVGIEVPNENVDTVGLKKIIASEEFNKQKSPLSFALGEDVDGKVYTCNLAKMPHLLVAGSTGSGKSVCLNTLLVSLIYRTSPEDLRIILVDPKRVEFGIYNQLPHLLLPKAITEPKKALNAFDWLINEMERRFMVFQDCYVKNIGEYNMQAEVQNKTLPKMPYIVLIVDELADLVVTTNKKELEEKIIRLTQKARAAGIHLILATQRPSVDIITGTIKINLPARIAFAVSQFVDSKTILDQGGAEKLLGRGDMLYSPSDGEPTRVQGAFVDTPEVKRVVDFVKDNNKAFFDDKIARIINSDGGPSGGGVGNQATVGASNGEEFDSLMPDALKLVIENGQASISMLQRRFSIGFSRAARIIDQMELAKFISSSDGSKPRNVFITMDDYNKIYGNR